MYICICNGLTDEQVSHAVANGADSASAVYRRFDCKAQCGKCVRSIGARVKASRGTPAANDGYGCSAAE